MKSALKSFHEKPNEVAIKMLFPLFFKCSLKCSEFHLVNSRIIVYSPLILDSFRKYVECPLFLFWKLFLILLIQFIHCISFIKLIKLEPAAAITTFSLAREQVITKRNPVKFNKRSKEINWFLPDIVPLMLIAMQTLKILIDSFQRYWWSKNPAILCDKRPIWPHPTRVVVSDTIFPWLPTPCKKYKILIDSFQIKW